MNHWILGGDQWWRLSDEVNREARWEKHSGDVMRRRPSILDEQTVEIGSENRNRKGWRVASFGNCDCDWSGNAIECQPSDPGDRSTVEKQSAGRNKRSDGRGATGSGPSIPNGWKAGIRSGDCNRGLQHDLCDCDGGGDAIEHQPSDRV